MTLDIMDGGRSLGATRSLDDIEHGLIRGSGRYNEPRIHFAVNCASIGCPALRVQAHSAGQIQAQLEDATRQFLSNRTRNRFEPGTLKLPNIFKWCRQDFGATPAAWASFWRCTAMPWV